MIPGIVDTTRPICLFQYQNPTTSTDTEISNQGLNPMALWEHPILWIFCTKASMQHANILFENLERCKSLSAKLNFNLLIGLLLKKLSTFGLDLILTSPWSPFEIPPVKDCVMSIFDSSNVRNFRWWKTYTAKCYAFVIGQKGSTTV